MHATPNQHLLALPTIAQWVRAQLEYSSSNPTLGTSFFFLHIITHLVAAHSPISDSSFYLVCRYLVKTKSLCTASTTKRSLGSRLCKPCAIRLVQGLDLPMSSVMMLR